jgi:cyanophycinase-like exopeptidase
MARLLAIMGSGETAPTMAKVHRSLIERVGTPAVLLDTPYGFQENADDISARAQEYFAQSVGTPIGLIEFRRADVDPVTAATAVARLREARYAFAGPGSPTYALRQWEGTPIPDALADTLAVSGCVTFASAAALTLGVVTVPVYEIYKAGETPAWRAGLNLLEVATGLRAAVIPHYDNAEGGHHDTRFCYLGERRLRALEATLPPGSFVLGVDEHTGVVIDLDSNTATVVGLGVMTVRTDGVSVTFPSGTILDLDDVRATAEGRGGGGTRPMGSGPSSAPAPSAVSSSPLLADATRLEAAFAAALAQRDVSGAVAAILELEEVLVAWSADTLQSDEPDRARAVLRSMIVRLGEVAVVGARDPRRAVAPFVELLLGLRAAARTAKDFATSDAIRDGLVAAGIEVRDTAGGAEWERLG